MTRFQKWLFKNKAVVALIKSKDKRIAELEEENAGLREILRSIFADQADKIQKKIERLLNK